MNGMVKFQLQSEWTAPFKEIRVPCSGKLFLLKKKKKCLNERKPRNKMSNKNLDQNLNKRKQTGK